MFKKKDILFNNWLYIKSIYIYNNNSATCQQHNENIGLLFYNKTTQI